MRRFFHWVVKIGFLFLLAASVYVAISPFSSIKPVVSQEQPLPELLVPHETTKKIQDVEQEIVSPPLRVQQEESASILTKSGILVWTNVNRITNNLPLLSENEVLDEVAQTKLEDMFALQYFAHISPAGEGVKDLADHRGYEFITIGENLALGNFKDDKSLVQAWMDSPGHKANILGVRYTEIGIAVGKGVYEGRETWLAVQTFALPLSSCPAEPSPQLLSQIEANKDQLTFYSVELESRKNDIEGLVKVKEYNQMIDTYNDLLNQTRSLIAEYNQAIEALNTCVQGR